MSKANSEIRQAAKEKNVPLWKLADRYNVSENTLLRRLRYEWKDQEKQTALRWIDEIAQERNEVTG